MKAYLITILILQSLSMLVDFVQLANGEFPIERRPIQIGSLLASMMLGRAEIAWGVYLLNKI